MNREPQLAPAKEVNPSYSKLVPTVTSKHKLIEPLSKQKQ